MIVRGAGTVLFGTLVTTFCFLVGSEVLCQDTPAKLTEKAVKSLGKVEGGASAKVVINCNGNRLAYLLRKGKDRMAVVCDGKEGPEYWVIYMERARFSPDGSRFVYSVTKPSGVNMWVCDGVEIDGHPSVPFVFSPDGRHTAYGSLSKVIRDGRPDSDEDPHAAGGRMTPVFSPDSQHLAYFAGYPPKRCMVCDGKKGPPFKEQLGDAVWTPDSSSFAYTVSQGDKVGDKQVILWGSRRLGPHEMIEGLVFSPDSKRLAYHARSKGKWSVVVSDQKGPEFINVGTMILFSPDGRRLAYPACDKDGWLIFCDSKKGPVFAEVGDPVFSPDGKHLAYRAVKEGRAVAICDGRESGTFDEVTRVVFSPDSKHLAFAAGRKGEKFMVCDGVETPAHATVLVPEHFDAVPGKLRYVVIDKDQASLVEVDWPADRTWEDAFKSSK